MKTNESQPRYLPLIPQIHQNNELNEERFQANIQKERSFYFSNSNLCQYYGQSNIEKCIFLLLFLISFSSTLIYKFYSKLSSFLFATSVATLTADSFSLILYLFFLYRLRSENIFDKLPSSAIKLNDFLIVFNSVAKSVTISLVALNFFGWIPFCLFLGKYIIEIYFMMIAVKLFLFCPGARYLQEQSEKIWSFVKFYVLCFEVEQEQDNGEYTKIEDIESFY